MGCCNTPCLSMFAESLMDMAVQDKSMNLAVIGCMGPTWQGVLISMGLIIAFQPPACVLTKVVAIWAGLSTGLS